MNNVGIEKMLYVEKNMLILKAYTLTLINCDAIKSQKSIVK